jgi:hypothetical protein
LEEYMGAAAMEVGEEREERIDKIRVSLVPPFYTQMWLPG